MTCGIFGTLFACVFCGHFLSVFFSALGAFPLDRSIPFDDAFVVSCSDIRRSDAIRFKSSLSL